MMMTMNGGLYGFIKHSPFFVQSNCDVYLNSILTIVAALAGCTTIDTTLHRSASSYLSQGYYSMI
jgi:hypothetical protein